ncbi:MAG: hypothetical protein LUC22_03625 [Prevotella sp.]|nr:hypothetical protein [Prevotella sp.]
MRSLANITPDEFRAVLRKLGLSCLRISAGYEMWALPGMARPVVFQTHLTPVPERVVRTNMRTLGISRKEFLAILESL